MKASAQIAARSIAQIQKVVGGFRMVYLDPSKHLDSGNYPKKITQSTLIADSRDSMRAHISLRQWEHVRDPWPGP